MKVEAQWEAALGLAQRAQGDQEGLVAQGVTEAQGEARDCRG